MGAGQTDQQVDIFVGGILRRVTRRRLLLGDGTTQITYWDGAAMVEPDAANPEAVFVSEDGCGFGCTCSRCRPKRESCDPCGDPCGGARQPRAILAGTVTGSPMVGSRLTYDPAVWTNALDARAYWFRGSLRMGSARQPYLLTDADVGYHIKVIEFGIGAGEPVTVSSNAVGPVVAGSGSIVQLLALPLVTGIAQVGQPLTYTAGTWSGNPVLTAFWQRSSGNGVWTDIGPAGIGVPYTVQQSDLGAAIRIREMANGQQALTAYSPATGAVSAAPASNVAPVSTSPPVVGGTPVQGSTVLYSQGAWTGTPTPAVTARWRSGTVDLGPATAGVPFTVPTTAIGGMLHVVETATNVVNTATRQSNQLGPVTAMVEPPTNVSPPSITGSLAIGQALTYVPGGWVGTPTPMVSAIWQRNSGSGWIDAGSAATPRTIASTDVGASFRVLETANSGGQVRTLASDPRGPVMASTTPPANTVAPVIAGTPQVGQLLTYTAGSWSGTPAPAVTAVWQRSNGASWTTISSAVAGTPYAIDVADVDRTIRVLETAQGSTTVSLGSNQIGPVTEPSAQLFFYDAGVTPLSIQTIGKAATGVTFRPFLPWNHNGTAASFVPLNNTPQVFVFPQMLGTDNQPLGINPVEVVGDEMQLKMAIASAPIQSRLVWPGSANATTGYRTSASLSTMGTFEAQYGTFRFRGRFSATPGTWPEVWIIPAWGEGAEYEIDLELNGGKPDKVSFNHFDRNWLTGEGITHPIPTTWGDMPGGATIDQINEYSIHWTREFIRYYVNDVLIHEVSPHNFHTPGALLLSYPAGNGVSGWQDLPEVGVTADPAIFGVAELEWTRTAADVLNMPVIVQRPVVAGGISGRVSPGQEITVTPATVTGGTLSERVLVIGHRKIMSTAGASLTKTLPADLDTYIPNADGAWVPVNVLETWTNANGGITMARSADILYRVKGEPTPPSNLWAVDQQRIVSQDIGGSEWYKYGITFTGNAVTEDTSTGEHGVGLSGMPREAGQIDVLIEAVVSGIEAHTMLQMQVADGSWSRSVVANYPIAGGAIEEYENGWTLLSTSDTDIGGGQRRLSLRMRTDATTTGYVWLLRGYVGGTVNYAGSATRKFTLISSSIKRVDGSSGATDETEVTGVTAQAPGNTYVPAGEVTQWGYNRNVFGQDGLTDGTDFTLRQWESNDLPWPGGFRFDYSFPNSNPNPGAARFCWGYPALTWGRGPWGPIFGTSGHPAPVAVNDLGDFTIDFDVSFSGQNGGDLMIDVYTLPDTAFDGDAVNEVSIFLSHNGVGPIEWLTTSATATHTFSGAMGDCAIYKQPTSIQVMVMPRTGGARREVLSGPLDLKEILQYLVSIGQVDGTALVAGLEFGVEPQRPNAYNSAPYSGSVKWLTQPVVTFAAANVGVNLFETPVDFTNTALWNPNGVTTTTNSFTEDTSGATHGMEWLGKTRAAGVKTYRLEFDVTSTTYLGFSVEVMNGSWNGSSGAIYRFGNTAPESGSAAVQGGWSNGALVMSQTGTNTYHVSHTFTTDASSTGFNVLLRGVAEDGGGQFVRVYTGNGTRSAQITNLTMVEV